MSGPNKSDRDLLGKRLKRRQFWADPFAWLVGGGLLIEYWKEIVDCFVNRHAPSLPLIGGLLVTAGVLGEVLFGHLVLITSEEIQERADSDVATANARAAQALDHAAIAEQAASEANLARMKIEEQLVKPHTLTDTTRNELIEILRQFDGHKRVDMFVYDHHIHEVLQLADSLNTTFTAAGWNSKMWTGAEPRIMGKEVTFAIARECAEDRQMQELAGRLSAVLFKLDIGSCMSLGGFSIGSPIPVLKPLGGWGIWNPKEIVLLRVQVGQRQLTSDLFTRPVTPPQG